MVPFAHPGGAIRVLSEASTANAEGCVYIGTLRAVPPTTLAYDPSITTTVIWLESAGSNTGWVDLDLVPGTYDMQVEADCAWRVTIDLR